MHPLAEFHTTEVDGVRTVWTEAQRPFTALMMFRVGFFDEALPRHGITHLVEHLALSTPKDADVEFNGQVEGHRTVVYASGHPDRVAAFLEEVCRNLADVPTDRLDVESAVLRREAGMRGTSVLSRILAAYYGPRGPGLSAYTELGLNWLGAEHVKEWGRGSFTKANAVLALTGPPDESWSLPLPEGRHPSPIVLPERTLAVPESPTLLETQDLGVSWGALTKVRRTNTQPEVLTSIHLLARRLQDRLRHDLGHVYAVADTYWRLDKDHVFVHLGVDGDAAESRQLAEEFLAVGSSFVDTGPTAEEIELQARTAERQFEDFPDMSSRGFLAAHAEALLCDWVVPPKPQDLVDVIRSQEPEAVRARFAEAYRQSYYVADLPPDALAAPAGPEYAAKPGDGVDFRRSLRPAARKRAGQDVIRIGLDGLYARSAAGWTAYPIAEIDAAVVVGASVAVLLPGRVLEFDLGDYRRPAEMERLLRKVIPADVLLPPPDGR